MTIEPITGETTATEPAKSCVDCAVKACRKGEAEKYPAFCLTKNMNPDLLQEAIDCYHEEENHKVMECASAAEAKFRSKMTRVEETIEFAKRMGAKKSALAPAWDCWTKQKFSPRFYANMDLKYTAYAVKPGLWTSCRQAWK